jgi:hypothetical protein
MPHGKQLGKRQDRGAKTWKSNLEKANFEDVK